MKVYFLNSNDVDMSIIDLVKEKLPYRYNKAMKYRFDKDFKLSIAASYLMLLAMPDISDDKIKINEFGKPYVDGIYFNISHSGEFATLVIDTTECGIDIEIIKDRNVNINSKIFLDDEDTFVKEDDENFFKLWTLKEAVLKLFGVGFNKRAKDINVMPLINGECIEMSGRKVYSKTFKYEEYYVSIASFEQIDEIQKNRVLGNF